MKTKTHLLSFYCLVSAILFAVHPLHDYDTWWHLAVGQWIWEHHAIPKTDIFSYTALGAPWVNHEWGAQVILWLVFSHFGATGLIVLIATLYWMIFILAARTTQVLSNSSSVPYLTLFFLATLMVHRMMARPHVFTVLFLAFLFYRLACFASNDQNPKNKKTLWILPPLFLAWANLHAGVIFGLGVLVLYGVGHRRDLKISSKPQGQFLYLLFACAFIVLLNPSTYQIYTFPFEHANLPQIMKWTDEWMSPFKAEWSHLIVFQGFYVLLGITLVLILCFHRLVPFEILLTGIMPLFLSVKWARHTDLLALWALPICASVLEKSSLIRERFSFYHKPVMQMARKFVPLILIVFYFLKGGIPYTLKGELDTYGLGIRPHTAPDRAVSFLLDNKIKAPLFNNMQSGGFLMLYGFAPFIDGRTPIFGDDFFAGYLASEVDPKTFEKLFEKWNFGVVFLAADRDIQAWQLHQYLIESPNWDLVYVDPFIYIYLDHRPEHLSIIQNNPITDSNVMRYLKWRQSNKLP